MEGVFEGHLKVAGRRAGGLPVMKTSSFHEEEAVKAVLPIDSAQLGADRAPLPPCQPLTNQDKFLRELPV